MSGSSKNVAVATADRRPRCGSAPASRRVRTASALRRNVAAASALCPRSLRRAWSAPRSSNAATAAGWPWYAARMSRVSPLRLVRFGGRPASTEAASSSARPSRARSYIRCANASVSSSSAALAPSIPGAFIPTPYDRAGRSHAEAPVGGLALRGKTRRCVGAGGDTARVIGERRGPSGAAEPGGGLPRGLALLVAGAFFMEILDGTVIAPAAPLIAADLDIRAVDVNIAISGYLVTVAVLIPIRGWAAEAFGARRVCGPAI